MKITHKIAASLIRSNMRGATRFHQVVCGGSRIEVVTKHGVLLHLSPYEYVDSKIIKNGYYEEEVLNAILSHIRPEDVFWDIGANLGIHALTLVKLNKDVRAFAFEPNPVMGALIHQSTIVNRLNVEIKDFALDNEDGDADFYVHEGNAGRSGLHNWENDASLKCIKVERRTGDRIVNSSEIVSPNILKIDVEGNEYRTLSGMKNLLVSGNVHTIIFEDSPQKDSAVKSLLEGSGFDIEVLKRKEDTNHDLQNFIATKV